jgi:hypothetical protein
VAPLQRQVSLMSDRLVVVEGRDDEGIVISLLDYLHIAGVQVINHQGRTQLGTYLGLIRRDPAYAELSRVLIVRDADNNGEGRFTSGQAALIQEGIPAPDTHSEYSATAPTVAIVILPGIDKEGAIEAVCLQANASEPATMCVTAYLDCLDGAGHVPRDRDKTAVHTFLASRPKPGLKIGEAARAQYFDLGNAAFTPLSALLRPMGPVN